MDDFTERLRHSLRIGGVDQRAERSAYRAIGAAIEVHKILGPGYPEEIYEAALSTELELRKVGFKRQVPLVVRYKDSVVGTFKLDLLIEDEVIVELKSAAAIAPVHVSQVIAYLKATDLHLGLILNFNAGSLGDQGIRRVVRTQ